jgi:hypothetical protein
MKRNGARKGRRLFVVAGSALVLRWPNMMCLASLSISALKVNLSFYAMARRRSRRYFIDQPLHIGIFRIDVVAEDERRKPRPAPERHVDDGAGVADHVFALGKMVVEDLLMAIRFVLVAVVGVFQILAMCLKCTAWPE